MSRMTTVTSVGRLDIGRTNAPRTLGAAMATMDGAGLEEEDTGAEVVGVEEGEESTP